MKRLRRASLLFALFLPAVPTIAATLQPQSTWIVIRVTGPDLAFANTIQTGQAISIISVLGLDIPDANPETLLGQDDGTFTRSVLTSGSTSFSSSGSTSIKNLSSDTLSRYVSTVSPNLGTFAFTSDTDIKLQTRNALPDHAAP